MNSASQDMVSDSVDRRIWASRILVVDDVGLMRKMIGRFLEMAGFTDIIYATDGDQVADMVAEHSPALIILDLNMPIMSGFDVCIQLRANEATMDLPILVQSATEAPQERAKAFEVGATDFISKPINPVEMVARVRIHLENQLLIDDLSRYKEQMDAELAAAREMQMSLLPRQGFVQRGEEHFGVQIESAYQASFLLGGDLWGGFPVDDTKLGIFVLDMTGHGVGSALNTFRADAVMRRLEDERHDPTAFLTAVNAELYSVLPSGQFATMFYGVIDFAAEELRFAGAGAPRPLLFRDGQIDLVDSSGFPVGIVEAPDYETKSEPFPRGSRLFCYSDVLIESEAEQGVILGEEGLIAAAEAAIDSENGEKHFLNNLLGSILGAERQELSDDLTAVSVFWPLERKGGSDE